MNYLTEIESRVIQMLLFGEDQILSTLRHQAEHIEVSERKLTGVGFFSKLFVPASVQRLDKGITFKLGDVDGSAINLKHGIGFLLYVSGGALSLLEGYSYDEPWPKDLQGVTLWYQGNQGRDLDKIKQIIHCSRPL